MADTFSNKIRKVTPFGVVTTAAGSGSAGAFDANGVLATFNNPTGIDVDASGNIYIADKGNNKIRKITPGGSVTTLAGSGVAGVNDATGASATFNGPTGVVADVSGNVYVADENNHKIRKITPSGVVTSLAGAGTPGDLNGTGAGAYFDHPHGIAIDASGNLYVTDNYNNRIKKVTPGGIVTPVAGSGTLGDMDATQSTSATFYQPEGISLDAAGNIYVADWGNQKIRKIAATGGVTTLAGNGTQRSTNGTGTAASFNFPAGAAIFGSYLYIGDGSNNLIRKIIVK